MPEFEQDHESYLRDCVTIDENQVEKEYVRISSDLAYWGQKYVDAHQVYLMAKLTVEETRSRLYLIAREKGKEGKAPSEATLTALVDSDESMHQVRLELVIAEVKRAKLHQVCEAIRAKKDLVVQLGASLRAQMQGDPVLRADTRNMRQARANGQ
jgi:hypothetical protein